MSELTPKTISFLRREINEEVVQYGKTKDVGLLVNSSRGIIYAGSDENFEVSVKSAAESLQKQMARFL
jgi:orotidine-5'-phosphate decarboxylase